MTLLSPTPHLIEEEDMQLLVLTLISFELLSHKLLGAANRKEKEPDQHPISKDASAAADVTTIAAVLIGIVDSASRLFNK